MREVAAAAAETLDVERYPNLAAMADAWSRRAGQGVPLDYTFGLDLLLDGLERRLAAADA